MKKILIITQCVDKNDPVLGFFHRWIEEFAAFFPGVIVICLKEGEHSLPSNVSVLSLGKELGVSRVRMLLNFYRYIWKHRSNYDAVFVHMNQVYVLLAGLFWRLRRKKISLWYVHKAKTLSLRIAFHLSNIIFTSARESFSFIGQKVHYVGHGIDTRQYFRAGKFPINTDNLRILSVGRITPIKGCEILIEAVAILRDKYRLSSTVTFVGAPMTASDKEYFVNLQQIVAKSNLQDSVRFVGPVSNKDVVSYYWNSDVSVNMSPTGGMDKTVLESLSSGIPVFVSNQIFLETFGDLGSLFFFEQGDARSLAKKIADFISVPANFEIREKLVGISEKFDISGLIQTIVSIIND